MTQSVVIALVGNKTPIPISEFHLRMFLSTWCTVIWYTMKTKTIMQIW